MLWLRTLLFTLIVPGTVLGLIPFALVFSGFGPVVHFGPFRWLGAALFAAGVAVIAWCFVDFIRRGRGTPAPYDPPRELVVAGLYRYVRNPQYVGVLLAVSGEAVWSGRLILLAYAAGLAAFYHLFVTRYEEPTLRRTFGESYARYCATVPRWLPRRWPIGG